LTRPLSSGSGASTGAGGISWNGGLRWFSRNRCVSDSCNRFLVGQVVEHSAQIFAWTEQDARLFDLGRGEILFDFGAFAGDANLKTAEFAQANNAAFFQGGLHGVDAAIDGGHHVALGDGAAVGDGFANGGEVGLARCLGFGEELQDVLTSDVVFLLYDGILNCHNSIFKMKHFFYFLKPYRPNMIYFANIPHIIIDG